MIKYYVTNKITGKKEVFNNYFDAIEFVQEQIQYGIPSFMLPISTNFKKILKNA